MARASVQYAAAGRVYKVPFQYIARAHVSVTVDSAPVSFGWDDETTIRLTNEPIAGALVEIRRTTPNGSLLVDFVDGSVLASIDLDLSALQVLFISQEALDGAERALSYTNKGYWDFKGRKTVNLGDPVDATSAVNAGWVRQAIDKELSSLVTDMTLLFVESEDQDGLDPATKTYVDLADARTRTAAAEGDASTLSQAEDHATTVAAAAREAAIDASEAGDVQTLTAANTYANQATSSAHDAAVASAKSYTDGVTSSAQTAAVAAAKTYTDGAASAAQTAAVATAKSYTDSAASAAQGSAVAAAKTYADTQDASTLAAAKTYADSKAAPANVARIVRGYFTGNGSTKLFSAPHNLNIYRAVAAFTNDVNETLLLDYYPTDQNNITVSFSSPPATGENIYWTIVG